MSTNENPHPLTVEEAVDKLRAYISLNEEVLLASATEEDLAGFHFSIGHYIRDAFGLWSGNEALLESCRIITDTQYLHVDDASMVILKVLWQRIKKEDRLNIVESKIIRCNNSVI